MPNDVVDGRAAPFAQTWFHGTKAVLAVGDSIRPGFASNYGAGKTAAYVFFTSTLDAAIWGAELAAGDGAERIYVVQPTSAFEDDPDLTDKRFPGNPTKSYRTQGSLLVLGEVVGWINHPAEQISTMKQHLQQLKSQGIHSLNDT